MVVVRLRFLVLSLAAVSSFHCGGDSSSSNTFADGGSPDATITGDPMIVSFTASHDPIAPYQSTALTWKVTNGLIVDISTPQGTLVSSFADEGTVITSPIVEATTYTLTVTGNGKTITQALTVHVDWPEPTIDFFNASPPTGFIGQFITLQWMAENGSRARMLRDGMEIGSSVVIAPAQAQGFSNVMIDAAMETFTLEISNPDHTVTQDVVVMSSAPPTIERFVITPRVAFQGTVEATISWSAIGVDATQLNVNTGLPIAWPGTLTGTISVQLNAPAFLQLFGFGMLGSAEADRQVLTPLFEQEPNDDFASTNDLSNSYGAVGSLASAGDVDIYHLYFVNAFMSPQQSVNLSVTTSSQDGTGCSVDTLLILRGPDFAELGRKSGGGSATGRGGECAVIDPHVDAFARRLNRGEVFIEVRGENGESGGYGLSTDEL